MHKKGLNTHLNLAQMGSLFTRGECCDVLKMDAEGAEFEAFLDGPVAEINRGFLRHRVGQLLIELHNVNQTSMRRLMGLFDELGYRSFSNETNKFASKSKCMEVSYVNLPRLLQRGATNVSLVVGGHATAVTMQAGLEGVRGFEAWRSR